MTEGPVVIVGASHAGFQLAASLRQAGFDGPVMLIGDEPVLPYQRPPLSKDYLDGKIGLDLLLMRPEAFYRDHRIEFLAGTRVEAIDRAAKTVRLEGGERLGYGHLVLATGARNRVPPLPGIDLDGVCYLRTLAETEALRQRLDAAEQIVVIGAGFIGLEFAAVACARGKAVQIVELTDRVMGRVVAVPTSQFFAEAHRRTGVEFNFGAQAVRIAGPAGGAASGRVDHIELANGERLAADLVLVSVGVVPNGELAAAAGLTVANGIVVDRATVDRRPCDLGNRRLRLVPLPSGAGRSDPPRSGAERRRPRALRRGSHHRQASPVHGSAMVLERAGQAAAADRRIDDRPRPDRAARRPRKRRVLGVLLPGRRAARHRVDQPARPITRTPAASCRPAAR